MKDFHNSLFDSAIAKINFDIIDGAYNSCESNWSLSSECPTFSRLFFVESGEATIEYASKTVILKPGYVYLIPCGTTISGYSNKAHVKLYFMFKVKLPDGNDLFSGINEIVQLHVGSDEIERIKNSYFSDKIFDILKLKSLLIEYALRMVPDTKLSELTSVVYSPEIQQVLSFIKENLSIQLSVKTLSEHFGIPATTLSKHFKNEVGVNIGKFIDDIVFDNAKMLLAGNEYSIQEISERLGFCDRFYFSRRFKSKYAITPHRYRKLKTSSVS